VAKMASTLDHISNGRLDIGLSAGWYQREAYAYGVAFPTASVRVEMLEESVILLPIHGIQLLPFFYTSMTTVEMPMLFDNIELKNRPS
jgi:hypothetical protein